MDFRIDKVIFQGTPAQFYAVAASYETQCDVEKRRTAVLTFGTEAPVNDAPLVYVYFHPGSIEARCLPRNRTLLTVYIPTENQALHEDWERLCGMLISEGWVEADSLPSAPQELRRAKAGTKEKIKNIAQERAMHIQSRNRVPTRTKTILALNSDAKTVRKHAPRLYERWDDIKYSWSDEDFIGLESRE